MAAVLLVGLVGCGGATDDGASGPAEDGGDGSTAPDQVVDTSEQADATAAVFADLDDTTPGCSVAVAHPGGEHLAGAGTADLDTGAPITEDTVFDLGSVSKQLTAGAVALLVADGRLDPDADVSELVPDLGLADDGVTVTDLLHHTSGLPDYIPLLDAEDDEVTTQQDALDAVATEDPVAAPGAEFQYSNTNYVLLAEVVEAVDGRSLVEFSAQEIFDPLGMDRTVVRDDQGTLLPDQARGYEPDGDDWRPVGSSWRQTGDGAVHAAVADLLGWMSLFLDGPRDGSELGSESWLEVMTTPGPLADGPDGYAGGLQVSEVGGATRLGHPGSWIGYGSALVMEPEAGVGVAVACNIDGIDAWDRAEEVLEVWSTG